MKRTNVKNKGTVRITSIMLIATLLFAIISNTVYVEAASTSVPKITYQGHSQYYGWLSTVKNGQTAGTTGKSKRLEAIIINLKNEKKSAITYRAHVQNEGWQAWKKSGKIAGTTGKSLRLEAVQIKLTGSYAKKYDIYYRVHVASAGWLAWTSNGKTAGSTGASIRVEAIQIKLVKKGTKISGTGIADISKTKLTSQGYVKDKGWLSTVSEGNTCGTTGQSRRLEAIKINLKDYNGKSGIRYSTHVSNIGWQGWKTSGKVAGTTGKNQQIEAIKIELTGSIAKYYNVYYRVHIANKGWLGWARNGEIAGSTGGGIRAEAVEIKLIAKSVAFDRGGVAYYKMDANQMPNLESKIVMGSYSRNQNCYPEFNTGVNGKNEGCACVSYAIARSIITGQPQNPIDFDIDGTSLLTISTYCDGVYQYLNSSGYGYTDVYNKLKQGLPVLMNFGYGAHYVVVIGVRQGANINALSASDFIAVDPWGGNTVPLTQVQHFSEYSMRIRYTKSQP